MFSIIIPTYNEANQIAKTINKVHAAIGKHEMEIIVVDGGSTDDTVKIAEQCGAIVVKSSRKGRAAQMNKGASIAKYKILYFLHADSIPPNDFTSTILNAYKKGAQCGCFRLAFDYDHWFLKVNTWFTRFNVNAIRFGDQSLFVDRDVFQKSGGFREDLMMMEDQEIIHRLRKFGKFKVLNDVILTSARKYLDNGVYRMQGIFYRMWGLYYLGYPQEKLLQLHRKLIKNNKL
ncbi:MAG: TIGR04283 family arsenosugar biosynthesis glycosyltransferase [Bacteroidota bacterium]